MAVGRRQERVIIDQNFRLRRANDEYKYDKHHNLEVATRNRCPLGRRKLSGVIILHMVQTKQTTLVRLSEVPPKIIKELKMKIKQNTTIKSELC